MLRSSNAYVLTEAEVAIGLTLLDVDGEGRKLHVLDKR
jgi:hypothetical protein